MDPKLMRWAGGDIAKLNIDPDQRDRLYAKYVGTEGSAARFPAG
jgi:hypothetical protein